MPKKSIPAVKFFRVTIMCENKQRKNQKLTDSKLQYSGHLMQRTDSLEKTFMLGKIEGRRKEGMAEDEMVGWHYQLNGHEFGWTS